MLVTHTGDGINKWNYLALSFIASFKEIKIYIRSRNRLPMTV